MPVLSGRLYRLAVSAGAVLAAFASAPAMAAPGEIKDDRKPTPFYVGVSECVFCHDKRREQRGGPPIVCACKEADTWLCRDKHQDAFLALDVAKNKRAEQMSRILWPHSDPEKDGPQQRRECLGCHAVSGPSPEEKPKALHSKSFDIRDGVGCIACHGAYKQWMDPHGGVDRDQWRDQPREDKEAKYGMTDLWNPARRVEVCASCHVGDRGQNKVVTHEMYAAGHPPLPSFEIGCACERLPRHWQLLSEKGDEARKLLRVEKEEYEETKLVVVGAAASFRQSMRLLAAQAADADKQAGALDFAQMDCAACHHDLKQPSWRQARGYAGKPGRPGFRSWPLTLLQVVIALADGDAPEKPFTEELKMKKKCLYDAFDARPYGDARAVAAAATDLADWADRLTGKLNSGAVVYNRDAALDVLRRLGRLPAGQAPDYDAARQIAWAFRVVYGEARRAPGAKEEAQKSKEARDALEALEALDKRLELDLPLWGQKPEDFGLPASGKERTDQLAKCADDRRSFYRQFVPAVLDHEAAYNPADFQQAFAGLARLLP